MTDIVERLTKYAVSSKDGNLRGPALDAAAEITRLRAKVAEADARLRIAKSETVTLHGWGTLQQWLRDGDLSVVSDSHGKYAITFSTIDGEPDCTSIRMRKLI